MGRLNVPSSFKRKFAPSIIEKGSVDTCPGAPTDHRDESVPIQGGRRFMVCGDLKLREAARLRC
jgi:hypothetical protein